MPVRVTQTGLRESFRVANRLGPFRPGVVVAVQRHALYAKPAALLERISFVIGGTIC